MEARVSQITVVVRNQATALNFYTQKVGFEVKTDFTPPGGARWVTVGPKAQDLELALYPLDENRPDPNGWAEHWKVGVAPPIVLRVDDCRAAFAELKARQVSFREPEPREYPWGVSATFSDPDGNLFSLYQPRSFTPAPPGR